MKNRLAIPDRLLSSFKKEGVIAFVGAGLSINEGMPSWGRLMEMMRDEVIDDLVEEELRSVNLHLEDRDYLIVADYLKFKMGEIRYKDFIERHFRNGRIGKIHQLLTSLPLSGIITTNYDEILSQSDRNKKFSIPFTWEDKEVFRKTKRPFILHAHGIASNPDSTIISSSDYANLSHNNANTKFWEAVKNTFLNQRVLFLGYSLNDPDLNLFLTKLKFILPGNTNEHFALIVSVEHDILNEYRLKHLMGITPIRLNSEFIGETTFAWLEALKVALENSGKVNLEELPNSAQSFSNSTYVDCEFLKKSFKAFLISQFKSIDEFSKVVREFKNDYVLTTADSVQIAVDQFVFDLPDVELRRFLVYLLGKGIINRDMKRLISYLPFN